MICPFCRVPLQQRSPDRMDEAKCASCGIVWVATGAPVDLERAIFCVRSSVPEQRLSEDHRPVAARPERAPCPCEDAWPHPSTFLG